MKKISNCLWGLVFIIIGVILALNALEITSINIFFKGFWTLFIIVPCFIDLFKDKDKTGNIIGIVIGLSLLLMCQGVLDFSFIWKLFFPAILVIIGLSLVFKDSINKKAKEEMKKMDKENIREYCATFSGQNLNFSGEEFEGCELVSVFGSIKCDLTKSKINEKAYIEASSIFGGIEILVPDDVCVKVVSHSLFGGVSNKVPHNEGKKTLYIEAGCFFGGVDIK